MYKILVCGNNRARRYCSIPVGQGNYMGGAS